MGEGAKGGGGEGAGRATGVDRQRIGVAGCDMGIGQGEERSGK